PVVLYDRGTLLRDSTYIDDLVNGIFLSLEKTKGFEIYNLGNSDPFSVLEMLHFIEAHLGKKANVVFEDKPAADAKATCADISKARQELGYEPQVGFEEGIGRFIKWFKEQQLE